MAAGRWPPSVSRRAVLALKGAAALVVALGSGGFMSSLHRAARAACSLSFSNHAALPALPTQQMADAMNVTEAIDSAIALAVEAYMPALHVSRQRARRAGSTRLRPPQRSHSPPQN